MSDTNQRLRTFRTRSATLSTFPWMSDFLLHPDEAISQDPALKTFFQAMQKLESQLDDGLQSMEALDAHRAMTLVEPGSQRFPSAVDVSPSTARRLCNVISAYRLLDVLFALESPTGAFQNPRYGRLPLKGLLPDNKQWHLDDWVHALEVGQSHMRECETFRTCSRTSTNVSMDMVTSNVEDHTLQAVLFKALHGFTKQSRAANMFFNLQAAAFCLSFMLKGCTVNDKLAVPNIPDDLEALNHVTIAQSAAFTKDEEKYFECFREVKELYKLRHACFASLLISPLYLLTGRKVTNNTWDQARVLRYSKALGNDKPEILVRVEMELWRVLLNVAMGRDTIYAAMQAFYAKLDFNEVDSVPMEDRAFFSAENSGEHQGGDLASILLSIQGETSLSQNWPLSELRRSIAAPAGSPDPRRGETPRTEPSEDSEESTPPAKEQRDMDVDADSDGMNVDGPDEPRKKRLRRRPRERDLGDTPKPKPRRQPPRKKPQITAKRTTRAKFVPFQRTEDGSFLKTIKVEEDEMEVTFDPSIAKQRIKGEEIIVLDPLGKPHAWTPEFHFQEDLNKFLDFRDLVMSCNTPTGKPRYLEEGYFSSVQVIPYEKYKVMSTAEVQGCLRLHHLVITGMPTEVVEFDESGLQELTNLESKVHFHDQSIPILGGDMSCQLRIGTLEHILENARNPNGAIINGLSFPLPLSAIKRDKLCCETEAWRLTEGLPFCTKKALYPSSEMRWGLASTEGSRHWVHVDSDGLATFVDPIAGKKWWILLRPHMEGEPDASAHIDLYLNDYDPAVVVKTWEAEAVLLAPGTRLIMRPNTPHAVFTMEHSIVLGGHFYSFVNLQDTVIAIIHCFVSDNLVTNTEHPDTRVLLFRMMQYLYKYYVQGADARKNQAKHLPDLTNLISLVDVLSLCNFCILANVLDYNTYSFPDLSYGQKATAKHKRLRLLYDYNALDPEKRRYFSYIRGLAMNLITWISCHYDVTVTSTDQVAAPPIDFKPMFAGQYLTRQAHALLHYKLQAEEEGIVGVWNCTGADVRRQLELLFLGKEHLYGAFDFEDPNLDLYTSLAFGDFKYRVSEKASPLPFEENDPETYGTTEGDDLFHRGTELCFPLNPAISVSRKTDSEDGSEGEVSRKRKRGMSSP